jgi:hypothetical protein
MALTHTSAKNDLAYSTALRERCACTRGFRTPPPRQSVPRRPRLRDKERPYGSVMSPL